MQDPAPKSLPRCARWERGPRGIGTPGSHSDQKRLHPKGRFFRAHPAGRPKYTDPLEAESERSAPHWRSLARWVSPGDSSSPARDASAVLTTTATQWAAGVHPS